MIGSALQIGQGQQRLKQQSLSGIADRVYKQALIKQMGRQAETASVKAQTELIKSMRRSPLEVPGRGQIGFDEWKSLDTKTKAYSYYAFDAEQRDEDVMPYNEWNTQTDPPTAAKLYNIAKEDPEFQDWLTKYKESGATRISIGEKIETKEAMGQVENIDYFSRPKGGLLDDVNKYLGSDEVQNKLIQYYDDPQKRDMEKIREKENFTVSKIKSAGGKIIDSKLDGRDFVWTVKWPNGKTTEVRIGN